MGSPRKLRYEQVSRPRGRDDTGSGAVCNELAMALALRRAAAALLLLLLAGASSPVWAVEDDPYSVTVSVDATSDTIGKARDMARGDGQRRGARPPAPPPSPAPGGGARARAPAQTPPPPPPRLRGAHH